MFSKYPKVLFEIAELLVNHNIVNKAQRVLKLINFFVRRFCEYRLSALTVQSHDNFVRKQAKRNVALNYSAIHYVRKNESLCTVAVC